MEYDIFFYETFGEERRYLETHIPEGIRAGYSELPCNGVPNAPIISIRTLSKINSPAQNNSLKAIITRTTGFDHLQNVPPEIKVGYLPVYCVRSVAEHAMVMWLALLRKLPIQLKYTKGIDRSLITGNECYRKKLLVFGIGNIGHTICKLGESLGMEVKGYDIVHQHEDIRYVGKTEEELFKALKETDIVVCIVPLTPHTKHYFSDKMFSHMKQGVIFINVSRGELVDMNALLIHAKGNRFGGIGLDVLSNENHNGDLQSVEAQFEKITNVLITSHNAFNTHEAIEMKAKQTLEQLEHFKQHDSFIWEIPRR